VSLDVTLQRALEELYVRYARALDDGALEDWPGLFEEDCSYLVIPRDNFDQGLPLAIMRCESRGMLQDRVRSVRETIMHEPRYLRHQITNVTGTVRDGGEIEAAANYLVIEVLQDELPKILSVGRYLDVIVQSDDGELRFREKRVVYDSVLVPNTIVYPL
jgi:salicylate 5-hydroxylase small subunit